jgi:hypothetical protein
MIDLEDLYTENYLAPVRGGRPQNKIAPEERLLNITTNLINIYYGLKELKDEPEYGPVASIACKALYPVFKLINSGIRLGGEPTINFSNKMPEEIINVIKQLLSSACIGLQSLIGFYGQTEGTDMGEKLEKIDDKLSTARHIIENNL